MFAGLALTALAIEALFGYPDAFYRRAGHPVTWIGRLIARADTAWNKADYPESLNRSHGMALVALLVVVASGAGLSFTFAAERLLGEIAGFVLAAIAASTLLAQRSLYDHVAAVAVGLDLRGLAGGREAVARIVGRDPASLDEAGVARAAIESLAENFSDGVTAPLFWMTILGLPGALAYKAINTADSMIGHKTEQHRDFGRVAARTDDAVNLPASRLAAMWISFAAAFLPATSSRAAAHAVFRDARHHRSPNAGWPEAAMAGALGLKLAGPRVYGGTRVDDPWMGNGRSEATADDIRRALGLYKLACMIQAGVIASLAVLLAI